MSGRSPLDEAALLEPVGDAGDVGAVAVEHPGQLAHRRWLVQSLKGEPLRRPEIELGERRDESTAVRAEHLTHESPCLYAGIALGLHGGAGAGFRCHLAVDD